MSRPIAFALCPGPVARETRVHSGPYVSKTDQSDQTDRRVENQGKFAAPLGWKLTARHAKLTSRPHHGRLAGVLVP
jgi:hypothetical protein